MIKSGIFLATAWTAIFLADSLAAEQLPAIPNPDFSRLNPSGEPSWWAAGTWPKGPLPTGLQPGKEEGRTFAEVPAVQNGGAGWTSAAPIPLNALKDGFQLCLEVSASNEYWGNHPWIFIIWIDKGKILARYDLKKISVKNTGDWVLISRDIFPQDIAEGATDMRISVASSADSSGVDAKGVLRYTGLKILRLGETPAARD